MRAALLLASILYVVDASAECTSTPPQVQREVHYAGQTSGCVTGESSVNCRTGEVIRLAAQPMPGYQWQDGDRFVWSWRWGSLDIFTAETTGPTFDLFLAARATSSQSIFEVGLRVSNECGVAPGTHRPNARIPLLDPAASCASSVASPEPTIQYAGQQSGCTADGEKDCVENEPIRFWIALPQGTQTTPCDTYHWSRAGANSMTSASTAPQPQLTFEQAGTYTVTLKYSNNWQQPKEAAAEVEVDRRPRRRAVRR